MLDRVTLEPTEIKNYSAVLPELSGPLSGAHAGIEGGEFYNYNLNFGGKPSAPNILSVWSLLTLLSLQGVQNRFSRQRHYPCEDRGCSSGIHTYHVCYPAIYQWVIPHICRMHRVLSQSCHAVLVVWQADYKWGGLPVLLNGSISVNTFSDWSEKRKTLFYVIDRVKGGVVGRCVCSRYYQLQTLKRLYQISIRRLLRFPFYQLIRRLRWFCCSWHCMLQGHLRVYHIGFWNNSHWSPIFRSYNYSLWRNCAI